MPSPTQITVSQLSRLLGTPAAPTVIDVCIDNDFNEDPRVISTAMCHSFIDIEAPVEHLDPVPRQLMGPTSMLILAHRAHC